MAIKPRPRRKKPKTPPFHLKLTDGVNYATDSEIGDNQAAYRTQNEWYDGKAMCSRPGLAYLFATSLGAGRINGFWDFIKPDGSLVTLVHWNTGLYTQSGSNQPVLIYNTLANTPSSAFQYYGKFYINDGANYLVYDGATVADVAASAYVPVLYWGKKPDGSGGTLKESLNQLCSTWYEQTTSQGNATDYYLVAPAGLTSIDDVKHRITGQIYTLGTDYTADVANKKITFLAGHIPPDATGSITNNIQIKCTKTGLKDPNIIKKCNDTAVFSGVVWFSGNPDNPSTAYWAGIPIDSTTGLPMVDKMPYYIPDDHYHYFLGEGKITKKIPCGNWLIVFKERCTHKVKPSTTGEFDFDFAFLDYQTGCNAPGTVRLVNGKPAFGNNYKGMCYIYNEFGLPDQLNIAVISNDINGSAHPGILNEQETVWNEASSVDDGKRYWLCIGNKAWTWDYVNFPFKQSSPDVPWWPHTNINAACWLVRDRDVYFGDRTNGLITKLIPGVFNDYGQPILHDIYTKKTDFGLPEYEKNIPRGWLVQKSDSQSRTTVEYIADSEVSTDSAVISTVGWDIDNLDIDNANVDSDNNDTITPLYPDITDTVQFQVHLMNHNLNEELSLINLSIQTNLTKEVD